MNIPKLRFKNFNNEWRKTKLSKLLTESKEKSSGNDNGIVLTSSRKGLFPRSTYFDGREENNTVGYSLVPKRSFTYRQMSDDNTFFINLNRDFELGLVSPEYPVFTTNDLLDTIYFANFINDSRSFKQYCQLQKKGGTRTRLYFKVLKELEITIPSIDEQKIIGSFFETLSRKIQLQQEKINLLKDQKQGYIQKIFSQEIRFKGENGQEYPEWEEHLIQDYLTESRVLGNKGDKAKKLTVKLWGKGVVEKQEILEGSSNTQYYVRYANQFMYGKLDFLNCAFGIVPEHLDGYESTLDSPAFDICPNINPLYLLYFILQKSFYKKYGEKANGSRKAKRIHVEDFYNMPIKIPIIEEQEKIAKLLSLFDQKIEKEQNKLESLYQQKQAFMQKMFI